jgi:arsenite methyltransferase
MAMTTSEDLKRIVRTKYASIAAQDKETNQASCCGATECCTDVASIMSDDYSKLKGYAPDADLGLGCGLPTEFAAIKPGDTVIDLGSGAGNDAFIARAEVGEDGRVIGIDFTPEMIAKARTNAEKLGYSNVEFREGDIEAIPVGPSRADVVVSNCVLNLAPNKASVFSEIFRVLKPGGHFSISDVVLSGTLPEALRRDAEFYAGCISGAIQRTEYLELIEKAGFRNVVIQREKPIAIPNDILQAHLTEEEMSSFGSQNFGLTSVTVYGEKTSGSCCGPSCCGN